MCWKDFARDLTDGKIVALRLQKDMNKKFEVGVTRTLKAVEREKAIAADKAEAARPALTIVQRSGATRIGAAAVTPRPRPSPAPAAAPALPNAPSAVPRARSGGRWKFGRVEIAAVIAIVLILILILTRL